MTVTETVVVGSIGRAHGVHGEVTVQLRTDEPGRRFAPGAVLGVEGGRRSLTVVSTRDHSGRFLVRFAELADRTAAEAARGAVLVAEVEPGETPDGDDEYYDRQLIGLRAVTGAGVAIGTVSAVLHPPGQDLLEVTTDAGPRLVPFVEALVPEIDLAAGTLVVVELAGLLADEAEPG